MIRSWRVTTLTGTAQPWFGDVLVNAITKLLGNETVLLQVADTSLYQVGDRILIEPRSTNQDLVFVEKILSGTQLVCSVPDRTSINAHAAGVFLQLSVPAAMIFMQLTNTSSHPLYVGADATITAAPSGNLWGYLLPQQSLPPNYNMGTNVARTNDGWMVGTAGDAVIQAAVVA